MYITQLFLFRIQEAFNIWSFLIQIMLWAGQDGGGDLGCDNSKQSVQLDDLAIVVVWTTKQIAMASNIFNEPPSFVSEDKSMAEYEADLRMWSRLTSLKPEQHAEAVVFYLGKQKNQIKDKIMTAIGDKLTNNKDGLEELIKFLKTIYSSDEMADSYEKYVNFEKRVRKKEEKLQEFIADWENLYNKTENKGCKIADMVLAFKLLQTVTLPDIKINLFLTGVSFAVDNENKNMLEPVKKSLRKFVGRSNFNS